MSLGTILIIVLILVLLGVIPTWPHSAGWGYGPSGIVGVILVILMILVVGIADRVPTDPQAEPAMPSRRGMAVDLPAIGSD